MPLELEDSGSHVAIKVGKRTGNFKKSKCHAVTVRVHGLSAKPTSLLVKGNPANGTWDDTSRTFSIGPIDVGPDGCEFKLAR